MESSDPIGPAMTAWNDERWALGEIAELTWQTYGSHIRLLVAHLGALAVADVGREVLVGWVLAMRQAGIAASTVNTRMATVRSFFSWAVDEGVVERDPTRRIKPLPVRKKPPRAVAAIDVTATLHRANLRGRTLILLAVQTGLRRAELANLRVEDWVRSERALYVREGKGAKERWVAVPSEAADALDAWVALLPAGCEWMWPSSYGHRRGEPLRPKRIADIVSEAAQLGGRRFTTHQLRHTTAKGMLRGGATLPEVAQQLGHSSVAVTGDVYGRATADEIQVAVEGRRYLT